MIKELLILIILLFASFIAYPQQMVDERAAEAMNTGNYFELYRIYASEYDCLSPFMRQFSKSMIDSFFNRPQSAVESIGILINEYGDILGNENMMSMILLLASNYSSLGEYNKAKDIIQFVLNQIPNDRESIGLQNLYNQYSELSKYEINIIKKKELDIYIPFSIEKVGKQGSDENVIIIDAIVNKKLIRVLLDTGASVNVVSKNCVERLGLKLLSSQSSVRGIGEQEGGFALVQEIMIGDLEMKNVPFHVIDISSGIDKVDMIMPKVDMIIGVEWITQMQEIQIDFNQKHILIPRNLSRNKHNMSNIFGFNRTAFGIEVETKKGNLILDLDTGSAFSSLSVKYYDRFKDEVNVTGVLDTIKIAGAGGIKEMEILRLPKFEFQISSNNISLKNIAVETESSIFTNDGIIGLDALMQYDKIILNTKDMFIDLIRE